MNLQRVFFSRFAVLVLIGVSLYSITGFLLAPRLFKNWIEATVTENSEKRLRIQEVAFNPYTFLLTLTDTAFHEAVDDRLLTIPEVVARVDVTRLIRKTLVFRDVDLRDVEISALANDDSVVAAPRIQAASINVDMSTYSTSVDRLRIERPNFRIERGATGTLNLPGWLVRLAIDPATGWITIRNAEIVGARASFTDRQITPTAGFESDAINGTIGRRGAGSVTTVDLDFKGRLFESGFGTIVIRWRASDPFNATRVELVLDDFALATISPYVREMTGYEVRAGRLDLALGYDSSEGKPETQSRISIDGLLLDGHAGETARESWPLDLAIALLEDDRGQIDVTLPAHSNTTGPESSLTARVTGELHDLIVGLSANPFEEMAVIADVPGVRLGQVPFAPGSAEITPQIMMRVAALSETLSARPRLGLITYPAYDAVVDRLALAAQQVRLHVALATSAGPPGQAAEKPIDFNNSKVRAILDEFSAARLSPSRRAAISRRYSDHDDFFYRAVFDALVENENVSVTALERLANYRARSFIDALATTGVPVARLVQSKAMELTVADHEAISLRLEATTMGIISSESGN